VLVGFQVSGKVYKQGSTAVMAVVSFQNQILPLLTFLKTSPSPFPGKLKNLLLIAKPTVGKERKAIGNPCGPDELVHKGCQWLFPRSERSEDVHR